MFAAELVRTRDRNGGVSDRFVSMGTEVSHIGLCPGCTNLRGVLVLTRMHLFLIPYPPPPHLPPLPSSLSLPLCLSRSLSLSPNPPLRPRILSLSLSFSLAVVFAFSGSRRRSSGAGRGSCTPCSLLCRVPLGWPSSICARWTCSPWTSG